MAVHRCLSGGTGGSNPLPSSRESVSRLPCDSRQDGGARGPRQSTRRPVPKFCADRVWRAGLMSDLSRPSFEIVSGFVVLLRQTTEHDCYIVLPRHLG
jgi:hypothetical protein